MGQLVPLPPAALRRPTTLRTLVPHFLLWLRAVRLRADNTILAYGRDLASFVAFCEQFGVESPDAITFRTIEGYLAWLQHPQGRTASTANRHKYAIGEFFKYLRREGVTLSTPTADVLPLKQPKRLPKYLTIPEQERILRVLAEDRTPAGRRDYALIATGLFCGLRVSELVTLRVEDVDLDAGVIRVIGKGDKQRECVIFPRLAMILRDYLDTARPALMAVPIQGCLERSKGRRIWQAHYHVEGQEHKFSTRTADEAEARQVLAEHVADLRNRYVSPFLFVRVHPGHAFRRSGQALLTRSLFHLVRRRLTPILGRPVHPHMLRHSFASRLRENGADLVLIQEAVGHANIQTTTIYAHLTTNKRKAEIAKYLEGEA